MTVALCFGIGDPLGAAKPANFERFLVHWDRFPRDV